MRETELYAPLKAYLEAQGYAVKAEIGACDMMARRGAEPPVVVEMKVAFTLGLVLQGAARQRMFDHVYLAVPAGLRALANRDLGHLCRRLGLGLLTVGGDRVTACLDPGPYAPRRKAVAAGRLLREFDRRVGDPNTGGATRVPIVTAYRQDAARCAGVLRVEGSAAPARIAALTGVARAGQILRDDHYGWFERVARGVYALSPKGSAAAAASGSASPGASEKHATVRPVAAKR